MTSPSTSGRSFARRSRALLTLAHDVFMTALAFLVSMYLRIGGDIATYPRRPIIEHTIGFAVIGAVVFWATRLYRADWRYFSMPDVVALVRAVTLVIGIGGLLFFLATRLEGMPRSTFVIDWFVMLALLGGPRFAYRTIKDRGLRFLAEARSASGIPVLVIGVRDGAHAFIREMARDPLAAYRVVGLIADKASRVGRDIAGVPVLGTIENLEDVVADLDRRGRRPQRLILAAPSIEGATVRRLLDIADRLAIPLARLPRLTDFQQTEGKGHIRIEPVAIEDLLGRSQAVLDRPSMQALIAGRRVLVTGAGGTIGGELARQIAALAPERLVLLDNSEYQLYGIDRDVTEANPDLSCRAIIGDVRDRVRIDEVLMTERPELVFHAAALKHVPIVEANAIEGVLTNVIGTRNVAESCAARGVAIMVLISTDKAVNPTNVMGATKRVAEMVAQARGLPGTQGANATRFVTVRFGNVLGSTGSVVPLFRHQLAQGWPLTVTHPDVTRFFMTVREAVELVLQSAALGSGEDARGKLFVLDMGEPVRIADLARQMIRLAGRRPETDVPIAFIGLRPGEKLHEELFHADEHLAPTRISGIRLAAPRPVDEAQLARLLDEIEAAARERREDRVLGLLGRLVPEFAAATATARAASG
ncbi:MAG TPA: nucleoside-diphosphate sugar epimerase/dehydratase [Stellaceae bacterium]|nr:nucleoside-diphosphate sugar epimerase/dehydratase [Stellaceae bacterium]